MAGILFRISQIIWIFIAQIILLILLISIIILTLTGHLDKFFIKKK
jgi:hypothetical protein